MIGAGPRPPKRSLFQASPSLPPTHPRFVGLDASRNDATWFDKSDFTTWAPKDNGEVKDGVIEITEHVRSAAVRRSQRHPSQHQKRPLVAAAAAEPLVGRLFAFFPRGGQEMGVVLQDQAMSRSR